MGAPVHIGVHPAIVVLQGVEHCHRLLGGGAIVQIDQRFAVDLLVQNRELGAQGVDIQCLGGHAASAPAGLAWVSSASSHGVAHSATFSWGRAINSSLTKPRLSMRLASAAAMPRDCR